MDNDDGDDGDDDDDDDDDDTALHSRSPVALFGVDNGGNDGGQTSIPDLTDSGVKVSVVVPKYVITEHGFTNLSL